LSFARPLISTISRNLVRASTRSLAVDAAQSFRLSRPPDRVDDAASTKPAHALQGLATLI